MSKFAGVAAPVRPADLAAVRQLLKQWTLEKYLHSKPPSTVVCLSDDMTIGQVLRLFAIHNILSAPIFEANSSHCSGFLDLVDILQAVLGWFNVRPEATDRADKLKRAGRKVLTERIRSIKLANDGHLVYRNGSRTTLLEVINSGFLQPVGARDVSHRIAIWDYVTSTEDDDAAADEGGFGVYITNIISQSDIIRFLHQHSDQLGRLGNMSVEALGLATKQVVCVPSDMPTINAFAAMCASHVSSAGVVQLRGHGALVGNLSVSDLRGILPEHFSVLAQPVMTFLELRRAGRCWAGSTPRNPRIQHATNGCNGWGIKSAEGNQPVHVGTCSPGSTLLEVIEILVTTRYHRIYVTSEDRRPCGIITLTDILKLIAGRHLSLPKHADHLAAGVQPPMAQTPRRSQSQPEGMQAFWDQAGRSPDSLRGVQKAPNLDLITQGSSASDYLGQLLDLELQMQSSAGRTEAAGAPEALRTISPAPPWARELSEPTISLHHAPEDGTDSGPGPAAKGSADGTPPGGEKGHEANIAGSGMAGAGRICALPTVAAVWREEQTRHRTAGVAHLAARVQPSPSQSFEDDLDLGELMTFDEASLLQPLPEHTDFRQMPFGRPGPLPEPPYRTESSPCSLADAFPSVPDPASLSEVSPAAQAMFSAVDNKHANRNATSTDPLQADAAATWHAGTSPISEHMVADLYADTKQQRSGRSGSSMKQGPALQSRPASPWEAPWYFGAITSRPATPDAQMHGSGLDGILEVDRFLADSPFPNGPPSRPLSLPGSGLSWQAGPNPADLRGSAPLRTACLIASSAGESHSPESPCAAGGSAAQQLDAEAGGCMLAAGALQPFSSQPSSGQGPLPSSAARSAQVGGECDGELCTHPIDQPTHGIMGLGDSPSSSDGCPPLPELIALADEADGLYLLGAARSGSLPRIADLQLGSPNASSANLQARPFSSKGSLSSQEASAAVTRLDDFSCRGDDGSNANAKPAGESMQNIMVEGQSASGIPETTEKRSAQAEPRGKGRGARQQHIFPHEAPALSGPSRRKWCKVSSDNNLTGWDRLP